MDVLTMWLESQRLGGSKTRENLLLISRQTDIAVAAEPL